MNYRTLFMVLYVIILCATTPAQPFLSKVMNNKQLEETVTKEYTLADDGVLNIENLKGNISVKADCNQTTIALTALKKAPTPEALAAFSIESDQPAPTDLTIKTACAHNTIRGSVDFELIVPSSMSLKLNAHNGSINVTGITGPVQAITDQGSINLEKIVSNVQATTHKAGAITIAHAGGNIVATTNKGSITIVEPQKSVKAATIKGNIDLFCQQPPEQAKLWLMASNNITVHLPANTKGSLLAKTERGKVICDHDLTIRSFTTKLNKQAWTRFQKEVNGILGAQPKDNHVKLYAKNGTIKILETERQLS